MPDFTARFTDGVQVLDWEDPASSTQPSRINPVAGLPHRRYQGQVGTPIEFACTVGGVEAPADGALGGRLFSVWFLEAPAGEPMISTIGGKTSNQEFTPILPGHYLLGIRRVSGGAVFMHLDVRT